MGKKYAIFIFLISVLIIFASCKGDKGTAGTDGKNLATFILQNGVSPYSAWQGITDDRILSGNPTYNHGSCNSIAVGYYNGAGTYESRALIKADLSVIQPSNVIVTNAYLTVYVYAYADAATVTAYALTTNWSPGTGPCGNSVTNDVSWNNSATGLTWAHAGGDFQAAKASNSVVMMEPGFYMLTLDAAMVQNWITNPSQNFGIILKGSDISAYHEVDISSSDGNGTYGPKFTIYYTLP
jgi:hypothetical protein